MSVRKALSNVNERTMKGQNKHYTRTASGKYNELDIDLDFRTVYYTNGRILHNVMATIWNEAREIVGSSSETFDKEKEMEAIDLFERQKAEYGLIEKEQPKLTPNTTG